MKLLEQILSELGADSLKSFSIVPDFGGYFRSIKGVAEYLTLGKYFEEDLLIKGKIKGVEID